MRFKLLCCFSMLALSLLLHQCAITQPETKVQNIEQQSSFGENVITIAALGAMIAWWLNAVHFQRKTYQEYLEHRSTFAPWQSHTLTEAFLTIASNLEN